MCIIGLRDGRLCGRLPMNSWSFLICTLLQISSEAYSGPANWDRLCRKLQLKLIDLFFPQFHMKSILFQSRLTSSGLGAPMLRFFFKVKRFIDVIQSPGMAVLLWIRIVPVCTFLYVSLTVCLSVSQYRSVLSKIYYKLISLEENIRLYASMSPAVCLIVGCLEQNRV